ncbi:MAG: hypothetical protein AAF348_17880 [Bacteroidota bacterium]
MQTSKNVETGVGNEERMGDIYFMMCANKLKCDTGDDRETIGLKASFQGYNINIYGNEEDNYELKVDEFGSYDVNHWEWTPLTPTERQLSILNTLLQKEVDGVLEDTEPETIDHEKPYEEYDNQY